MKTKLTHWLLLFSLILMSGTALMAQQEREEDHGEEEDNPQARIDFELLRTKNPETGRIPLNIRAMELAFMRSQNSGIDIPYAAGDITNPWKNRGPFNVGGRTRALAVDIRDENIILAGGVSGGMWRSTDQGQTWQKTTGSDELQSVSCIAQDPTNPDTWYYGTGEFSGNSASGSGAFFLGDGIYKSTDNGQTWAVLSSTQSDTPESFDSDFDINLEMVVDPTNGDLYVATVGKLFRSSNGGTTFSEELSNVLTHNSSWVDVAISDAGTIFVAFDEAGVFRKVSGNVWINVTPSGFSNVVGERKELAIAPSNENVAYLISEHAERPADYSLWKFDGTNSRWTEIAAAIPQLGGRTGDFDSQGGYDLLIKVKPDDENFVIIGGTNLFRSTDGFATTGNTDWIGGYTPTNTSFGLYTDHHPDQHTFVFLAGDRAISGNDGGLQVTNNIRSDLGTEPVDWIPLNNGYVTTQVYALSAGPGDQIMAGFQDNSTWLDLSTASDAIWTDQFGGDGAYNAFNADGTIRYMSSQFANIFRVNYNEGADDIIADGFTEFTPDGYNANLFIVPFYLDPVDDDLFYLAGESNLHVNTQASTGSSSVGWKSINLGASGVVSEIGVSFADVVFAGTTVGELFRITNPGGNEIVTDISGTNFPSGYISAIAVDPVDENSILVTFSNYGIPSVFYTSDGGANWDDVSGNLEENTDGSGSGPSVRSAAILGNGDKFFVGTSTGLYSTTSLAGASVTWVQEDAQGMGEVVVEHLVSRLSDGLILAGTHGNGVYSANFEVSPVDDNDLGVVAITSPEDEILSSLSDAVTISARIRNFGALAQNSFDIAFLVDDNQIATETISQSIDAGEEIEVSFETTFDFSTAGTYSLKVGVALDGDENDANDTRTVSITSIDPIQTFPYFETFDDSDDFPAQWEVENSTLRWLVNSGGTPSGDTGPQGDNTSGDGNYVYTEASQVPFGEQALLTTPWISVTGMERPALQFYYHMFGFQMGTLEVLAIDSEDNVTSLVTISGQQQQSQGDAFREELVELDEFIDKQIRIIFKGTIGTGFRSDIAIDDIRIFNIPLKDLSVTDIESPEEQVSGEEPVIIEVTNLGLEAQSGFEVSYSVNGELVATETVSGTLAPGASVTYPFTELFDFSETGGYELTASVSLTGDEDPSNDDFETVVTNLPFTGYYIMEQQGETSVGPSNEFGNSYLFDGGGISKVFISAESITLRTFDIRYFNYASFNNSSISLTFDLKDNGETEITDDVFTGLGCGAAGQILLGPGDTNGTYDETNDSQFSLIIKEDIFQGCQVGSSDVSFLLSRVPAANEADSLALLAFYESTGGPDWNETWDLEEPVFFWHGVGLSSSGRVVALDMINNNLEGTIPSEIGDLDELRLLRLAGGNLSGGIPAEIGDLMNLEALILSNFNLGGTLPPEIGDLLNLKELSLTAAIEGELPVELSNLSQLESLNLFGNQFTGSIPGELGALTNLTSLTLHFNEFSGEIPTELGNLTNLTELVLSGNNLEGEVPASLQNLTDLDVLQLNDNQLTGLPDLSALGIANFIAENNRLDFLDIVPNVPFLSSYIPQAIIGDPLVLTGIAGNNLSLETVTGDDGNNVYQWFKDDVAIPGATNATYVFNYAGQSDEGLYRCDVTNAGAPGLTLSRFITVVDQSVTSQPDYAALAAFYNATGGANWNTRTNWLSSAALNTWHGVSTDVDGRVTEIDLQSNDLAGTLPPELGDLTRLQRLVLSDNRLSGELPAELYSLTDLTALEVGFNNLSGTIPAEIGNLTNLLFLTLHDNEFTGTLPPEIGALSKLVTLYVGSNQLTGPIPSEISGLVSLSGFDFVGNDLSGTFPMELTSLTSLTFLRLTLTNLEGQIPPEIGQFTNLLQLELANNNLEGSIPPEIGNLTKMRSMSLHFNELSGEIPAEMTNLTDLETLNLTRNNLSGSLPAGFSNLSKLTTLFLDENMLSGLPDLSSLPLTTFDVQDNSLNFGGIVPNVPVLTEYEPQADIDDPISEIVNQGTEYTMEVSDDTFGNLYQWYRNETPIDGADERTYTIADFQVVDEGVYTCEVTNPGAPDLTLFRNPVELGINYSPTAITIDNMSVPENEAIGTLVGTLSVEDIDLEDEYEWVLSGTDAASFSLDVNLLKTNAEFDFETDNSFDITISVKDQGGLSAQVDFTISVTNVNEVPMLVTTIDDMSADEDAAFELSLPDGMFSDEDGDELEISLTGLPSGLSFDAATNKISGTPLQAGVGVNTVTVTATDPSDASASDSFDLTIINVNDTPVVGTEQADVTTDEDASFEYTIPDGTFEDEDGDDLTLSVSGLPASLSFDAATGTISGTPLQADVATHTIEVTATDPSDETVTDSFELTVSNVNDSPVLSVPQTDQAADEDAAFDYEIPAGTFTDEDGDALTLAVTGLPSTLSFDAGTGRITGTPLVDDVGSYTIEVSATDPDNASVTDSFELVVAAVNDAPVLVTELPDVQTDRDAPFELVVDPANVTDEEGDPISISASGLPASLTMTDGTISGTPVLGENGDFTVTITYSDGNGGSITDSFVLTVNLVTSLEEEKEYGRISVQPNPFDKEIRIEVEKGLFGETRFMLQPVGGKSVWNSTQSLTGQTELTLQINKPVAEGIYLLVVMPEGRSPIVRKVIRKE